MHRRRPGRGPPGGRRRAPPRRGRSRSTTPRHRASSANDCGRMMRAETPIPPPAEPRPSFTNPSTPVRGSAEDTEESRAAASRAREAGPSTASGSTRSPSARTRGRAQAPRDRACRRSRPRPRAARRASNPAARRSSASARHRSGSRFGEHGSIQPRRRERRRRTPGRGSGCSEGRTVESHQIVRS